MLNSALAQTIDKQLNDARINLYSVTDEINKARAAGLDDSALVARKQQILASIDAIKSGGKSTPVSTAAVGVAQAISPPQNPLNSLNDFLKGIGVDLNNPQTSDVNPLTRMAVKTGQQAMVKQEQPAVDANKAKQTKAANELAYQQKITQLSNPNYVGSDQQALDFATNYGQNIPKQDVSQLGVSGGTSKGTEKVLGGARKVAGGLVTSALDNALRIADNNINLTDAEKVDVSNGIANMMMLPKDMQELAINASINAAIPIIGHGLVPAFKMAYKGLVSGSEQLVKKGLEGLSPEAIDAFKSGIKDFWTEGSTNINRERGAAFPEGNPKLPIPKDVKDALGRIQTGVNDLLDRAPINPDIMPTEGGKFGAEENAKIVPTLRGLANSGSVYDIDAIEKFIQDGKIWVGEHPELGKSKEQWNNLFDKLQNDIITVKNAKANLLAEAGKPTKLPSNLETSDSPMAKKARQRLGIPEPGVQDLASGITPKAIQDLLGSAADVTKSIADKTNEILGMGKVIPVEGMGGVIREETGTNPIGRALGKVYGPGQSEAQAFQATTGNLHGDIYGAMEFPKDPAMDINKVMGIDPVAELKNKVTIARDALDNETLANDFKGAYNPNLSTPADALMENARLASKFKTNGWVDSKGVLTDKWPLTDGPWAQGMKLGTGVKADYVSPLKELMGNIDSELAGHRIEEVGQNFFKLKPNEVVVQGSFGKNYVIPRGVEEEIARVSKLSETNQGIIKKFLNSLSIESAPGLFTEGRIIKKLAPDLYEFLYVNRQQALASIVKLKNSFVNDMLGFKNIWKDKNLDDAFANSLEGAYADANDFRNALEDRLKNDPKYLDDSGNIKPEFKQYADYIYQSLKTADIRAKEWEGKSIFDGNLIDNLVKGKLEPMEGRFGQGGGKVFDINKVVEQTGGKAAGIGDVTNSAAIIDHGIERITRQGLLIDPVNRREAVQALIKNSLKGDVSNQAKSVFNALNVTLENTKNELARLSPTLDKELNKLLPSGVDIAKWLQNVSRRSQIAGNVAVAAPQLIPTIFSTAEFGINNTIQGMLRALSEPSSRILLGQPERSFGGLFRGIDDFIKGVPGIAKEDLIDEFKYEFSKMKLDPAVARNMTDDLEKSLNKALDSKSAKDIEAFKQKASEANAPAYFSRSRFLTNRVGNEEISKELYKFSRDQWLKSKDPSTGNLLSRTYKKYQRTVGENFVDDFLTKLIGEVDAFSSKTLWSAAYEKGVRDGLTESQAVKFADDSAERIIAGRATGDQPAIFNTFLGRTLLQYGLEVLNEPQVIKEMITLKGGYGNNKPAKALKAIETLTKWMATAYITNNLIERVSGRRPASDILGVTGSVMHGNETVANIEKTLGRVDSKRNIPQELEQTITGISGIQPGLFDSSSLPSMNIIKIVKDWVTGTSPIPFTEKWDKLPEDKKKALLVDSGLDIATGMMKGGGQLRKTIKGIESLTDEGYISPKAIPNAPQESTSKDPLKALLTDLNRESKRDETKSSKSIKIDSKNITDVAKTLILGPNKTSTAREKFLNLDEQKKYNKEVDDLLKSITDPETKRMISKALKD